MKTLASKVTYCPETGCMYCNGQNLSHYKRYYFNFSPSGLFTLLDKQGEPLYELAVPLFEKLISHLIWIFFWIVLILFSNFFFPSAAKFSNYLLMSLIFFHLLFFGIRLTTLLVMNGLKPILFPPLWTRLTHQFQKGGGIELLQRHQLEDHPGLLVNLVLVQHHFNQVERARETLRRALLLCPEHPVLQHLFYSLDREDPDSSS